MYKHYCILTIEVGVEARVGVCGRTDFTSDQVGLEGGKVARD